MPVAIFLQYLIPPRSFIVLSPLFKPMVSNGYGFESVGTAWEWQHFAFVWSVPQTLLAGAPVTLKIMPFFSSCIFDPFKGTPPF